MSDFVYLAAFAFIPYGAHLILRITNRTTPPETEHTMSLEQTPFGFIWGPATIQRSVVINHVRVMRIFTDHRHLEIAVSPQGQNIRVFLDGEPMTVTKANQ